MKKLFNHAISGLLLVVLLCSSLGIVQGSNFAPVQESETLPVTTYDLTPTSAVEVDNGGDHTCAVTTEGGIRCWGGNYYGQLGDGTKINSPEPVDVIGFTGEVVIAVSPGANYTCALTSDGEVKCWGDNYYGQLGNETSYNYNPTPQPVHGLDSVVVKEISAGYGHVCLVTSDGKVMCWGNNGSGQLGYVTTPIDFSNTPMFVSGLDGVVVEKVSAGDSHTCVITSDNRVLCWGYNGDGQLGDGTRVSRIRPEPVKESPSADLLALAVSLGEYHTCAITLSNGVKCWGYNYVGQLGNGTTTDSLTPVSVIDLENGVVDLGSGGSHNCVLTTAGGVKCWGDNDYGQLGDSWTSNRTTPVDVVGLASGVKGISAGSNYTCALTSGGAIKCWGKNDYGQLGDGTTTRLKTPVDVIGLTSGVSEVSAAAQYTCALTDAGGVKCWGDKFHDLYDPDRDWENTSSSTPIDIDGLTNGVKAISSGKYHTCAITALDGVKCWGYNSNGQLGDGTYNNRPTPVDVVGFEDDGENAIAISAGDDHTCVLTVAGGVKCWGNDSFGQLGNGSATNMSSNTPVDVDGLVSGVDAISVGESHTCVLTSAGGIKCWGNNSNVQLGFVTTETCNYSPCSSTPNFVEGFTDEEEDAIDISAGNYHTCAVTSTNAIKCWGYNENGQLGNGTYNSSSSPVTVSGFGDDGEDGATVSAGYQHTCTVTKSGAVKCWGYNSDGQLGDGTIYSSNTPVDVLELTSGVKAVSTGEYHTCAITDTDETRCWGDNSRGQLGWRLLWVPVDVIGFVEIIDYLIYLPVITR